MLATGELLIRNARRELVGAYKCVTVSPGRNATSDTILLRLDFSSWYAMPIFSSVFWGSVVSSAIFCAGTFVINIIWILVRKATLWWLNRAERMQRVRSMVEAMEKYRQRQLASVHDTYHRRVNAIRDNYHQQMEQIRMSYSNQADRFRSYRQAQQQHVAQQLDTLRDNYNQQVGRIREYGSKRAEALVESYERQLNRMRTFTLQQRLKLMRQYQVKQRYINKLLETIADTDNPETISKQEAAIRAALDLPDPPLTSSPLAHSTSYHSLPDLSLQEYSEGAAALFTSPQRSFDTQRLSGTRLSQMAPGTSGSRPGTSTEETSLSNISSRTEENGARDPEVTDPLLTPRRKL
ncbi:Protein IGLR-2 a [Aphelenchoides avenae]|nr:Protein IGLR-2 a [Aphelenchus avenae]